MHNSARLIDYLRSLPDSLVQEYMDEACNVIHVILYVWSAEKAQLFGLKPSTHRPSEFAAGTMADTSTVQFVAPQA